MDCNLSFWCIVLLLLPELKRSVKFLQIFFVVKVKSLLTCANWQMTCQKVNLRDNIKTKGKFSCVTMIIRRKLSWFKRNISSCFNSVLLLDDKFTSNKISPFSKIFTDLSFLRKKKQIEFSRCDIQFIKVNMQEKTPFTVDNRWNRKKTKMYPSPRYSFF